MATKTQYAYQVLHGRWKPGGYDAWACQDLLMPVEVHDRCAPDYATAKIEFNFPRAGVKTWQWRRSVAPDDMVAVASVDGILSGKRQLLFLGYVAECSWSFDRSQSALLTAVSSAFRLLRDQEFQVVGSGWKSKAGDFALCTGVPCAFNPEGRPNRSAAKIHSPNGLDVHHFVDACSAGACYWRLRDAVNYLLQVYNPVGFYSSHPEFLTDQAATPIVYADVDGMGLWAALARLCNSVGYDLCETVEIGPTSMPSSRMVVVKRGSGAAFSLKHQDGGVMDLDATNLFAARVTETVASCLTAPIVLGGRELVEVTVPLQCAFDWGDWFLTEKDEAGNTDQCVGPGQEDKFPDREYVRKFTVGGSEFSSHAWTGRLWDANTDGYYGDHVAPWFSDIPDMAFLAGEEPGTWPLAAYAPLKCLTRFGDGPLATGQEALVEITWDWRPASPVWLPLKAAHSLVQGRLAVYITERNLVSIRPHDGTDLASPFWMLNDMRYYFGMRITCTIETPRRNWRAGILRPGAGTLFRASGVFERSQLGQVRRRSPKSRFANTTLWADVSDGEKPGADRRGEAIQAEGFSTLSDACTAIQDANEDRFVEAGATLEWIEDVPLLATVRKIEGIDVDLAVNAGAQKRYPRVVGRIFRFRPDQQQTELILDTDRQAAVK